MPWRRFTIPVSLPFPHCTRQEHRANSPWQTDEEARPAASKVLSKWRPEVMSQQPREMPAGGTNGVQQQLTTNA